MVDRRTLQLLLPAPVRTFPADLVAVVLATAAVNVAVFAPVVRETPLRVPLGLVFVCFVTGYAFVAALFPEAGTGPRADDVDDAAGDDTEGPTGGSVEDVDETTGGGVDGATEDGPASATVEDASRLDPLRGRRGIDGVERAALSFGTSVAIVPLLGLALTLTPWGLRLGPIMVATSGSVLVATAVAAARRRRLAPDERFRVPYRRWLRGARTSLFEPSSRADAALNVALVASMLLAVGALGFAVLVPPSGEAFSAIYLLTEDGEGELVADGYPEDLLAGEHATVVVGVDNDEGLAVEYTVVAVEQRLEGEAVVDSNELDRFAVTLEDGERSHREHAVEPTMTGEVRVAWLLYLDDVPAEPSQETAANDVHLWLTVTEPTE